MKSKQQEALRNEKQNLNQAIRHRAQQEVFAIARKTLMDLAETSLEERTVEVFSRKLHELKDEEKEQMAQSLAHRQDRCSFSLPSIFHRNSVI